MEWSAAVFIIIIEFVIIIKCKEKRTIDLGIVGLDIATFNFYNPRLRRGDAVQSEPCGWRSLHGFVCDLLAADVDGNRVVLAPI
jgi:hypothetical protein